ncbi:hypothetical protein HYALB_00011817 [Hymenoscyphus albidus]|uniref:RRM domain-containing protein n=1 Tax=Hymenoscyphus albidus TaxID=595503 RepID=A0A9N9LNF1_9HELO|nr:hypothetical protein HYALB_00011817 [Hymenoscyphus albidus]
MPSQYTRDEWAATLMVSGLSGEVSRGDLLSLFEVYGTINSIFRGKCSQGFAFVTFEDDSGVSEARRELNGYRFKGCTFDVRPAR